MRQRRRRHRNLRPHSSGARRRRVALAADPTAPLHGVPNPTQLQPGTTAVVGASHSGYDIAYEVAADRPTILVGPDRGNIPLDWDSARVKVAMPLIVFLWKHVLTRRTPMGRKKMHKVRHQGAPTARVKPHHLAERGVERIEHKVTDVSPDGKPVLDDGRVLDVANVIWATGFRPDFGWIEAPITGDDGWPREYRGVVDGVPGLFFCGLSFQFAFSSMVLPGVGRDAAYVAARSTSELRQDGRARRGGGALTDLVGARARRSPGRKGSGGRGCSEDSAADYPRAAGRGGRDGRHRGSPPSPTDLRAARVGGGVPGTLRPGRRGAGGRGLRRAGDHRLPARPAQRLCPGASAGLPGGPRGG